MANSKRKSKKRSIIFAPDFTNLQPKMQEKYRIKIEEDYQLVAKPVESKSVETKDSTESIGIKDHKDSVVPVDSKIPEDSVVPVDSKIPEDSIIPVDSIEPIKTKDSIESSKTKSIELSKTIDSVEIKKSIEPKAISEEIKHLIIEAATTLKEIREPKVNTELVNEFIAMLTKSSPHYFDQKVFGTIETTNESENEEKVTDTTVSNTATTTENVDNNEQVEQLENPQNLEVRKLVKRLAVFPHVLERPFCEAVIEGQKKIVKILSKRGNKVRYQWDGEIRNVDINSIEELKILNRGF